MSDDDDKQYEASQRRLDEARKRGEIPRSTDLTAAASYGGLLLGAVAFGEGALLTIGNIGRGLLDRADSLADAMARTGQPVLGPIMQDYGLAVAPLFALPMVAVAAVLFALRAFIFAPEKLAFKWSRLSPLTAARHKFGREGLFEFGKNFAKMLIIAAIVGWQLVRYSPEIMTSLTRSPAQSGALMMRLIVDFLMLIFLFSLVTGGFDYLWQRAQHLRRNRMSRKDMMDEMKEGEGDPHVKGQRRQRAQEIALNRMLQDVATADVVIVNPTHYAVALRWKRSDRTAPICVAKGVDEIAARIRERAVVAGVPLRSDPPTARAVYAAVEIGQPILPAHYRPVAAAIRFAEALRKRKRTSR